MSAPFSVRQALNFAGADAFAPEGSIPRQLDTACRAVAELAATQIEILRLLELAYCELGTYSPHNPHIKRARAALHVVQGGAK